jgi:hypothetical protein
MGAGSALHLLVMKTLIFSGAIVLALTISAGTLLADSPVRQTREVRQVTVHREQPKEVTVFVAGSLIPKRIKVEPVATTTVSPLRVIDQREIDSTGRFTTPGAFVNEPAVRIINFNH